MRNSTTLMREWRYSQVGRAANARLIYALANAPLQGQAIEELDRLSRSQRKDGHRVAVLNPVSKENSALFEALLSGEFALKSFRNADLLHKIFASKPKDRAKAKRRIHRANRLIAKLRGHHLISKVQNSRLYRVSQHGVRTMWTAIFTRCGPPLRIQSGSNIRAGVTIIEEKFHKRKALCFM
jgi:hypothetical protein